MSRCTNPFGVRLSVDVPNKVVIKNNEVWGCAEILPSFRLVACSTRILLVRANERWTYEPTGYAWFEVRVDVGWRAADGTLHSGTPLLISDRQPPPPPWYKLLSLPSLSLPCKSKMAAKIPELHLPCRLSDCWLNIVILFKILEQYCHLIGFLTPTQNDGRERVSTFFFLIWGDFPLCQNEY